MNKLRLYQWVEQGSPFFMNFSG